MTSSQRIVLNTLATYVRSVFTAGLFLFSSRWVLGALGQSDYGLYSVVGSIITLIVFLNSVMAASAARHFAYSIGQGDTNAVNQWFNAAFSIHLVLPIVLILIGWPIGEYCIAHILKIPLDRISTCVWIFRISLVSAFFSMVSIPFSAMFTAKQHIVELAVWGILQSILMFSFAFMLTDLSGDRLFIYATGMVAITVCVQIVQGLRGIVVFRECTLRRSLWFDEKRSKAILSFALWSLFGNTGGLLRYQGMTILLNLYYGPKVNAAFGIANVVSVQSGILSTAMLGSFSPEITASEGRGDRARVLSLALRTCKFGTLLVMLFAIPIMVEIDYVLKLWLLEPPAYTGLFCQLMLVVVLIDQLTVGHMIAVSAHGKIGAYQATLGSIQILSLPLAWLFLTFGFAPTSVVFALIITSSICALGRVLWGRYLLSMPVHRWLTNVIMPCAVVAATSSFAALAIAWWLPPSFSRLASVTAASVTVAGLASWFIALDVSEREFLMQTIRMSFAFVSKKNTRAQ